MTKKKLTLFAFVMMILTSVFGVANIAIGFYRMGYAAIPLFILAGILFFIPFILMMIEFGSAFKEQEGGIYVWMQKSVGIKFAFIGIFMWYSSYIVWMFGKAVGIWVYLSYLFFGKDITINKVMVGNIDFGPFIIGMLGICLIAFLAFLIKFGTEKFAVIGSIGGISVIVMNLLIMGGGIIVFFINGMELQEPLTAAALTHSPNPEFQSLLPFLGFVVFSVFAFGGVEAMAGIGEDLENPKRDLTRGILIAGVFTILFYVLGFLMVGSIINWTQFGGEVTSLSAIMIIADNLGKTIAGDTLGAFFQGLVALGMFLSTFGALIALSYAPLKQLIGGTPKEFWPKSFQKENKNGIKINAVKVQALIVIILLFAKSALSLISPEGADALFELTITMMNVSMTIPYLFLIFAWYKFKNKDGLTKDIVFIKSKPMIIFTVISTTVLVLFGNVFTIVEPFISGNYSTGIWTIVGPVLFTIIAFVIYEISKHKVHN